MLLLIKLQTVTLLKVELLHGCFSCFLDRTNSTKSHSASHLPRVRRTSRSLSHMCLIFVFYTPFFSGVFRWYKIRSFPRDGLIELWLINYRLTRYIIPAITQRRVNRVMVNKLQHLPGISYLPLPRDGLIESWLINYSTYQVYHTCHYPETG